MYKYFVSYSVTNENDGIGAFSLYNALINYEKKIKTIEDILEVGEFVKRSFRSSEENVLILGLSSIDDGG